MMLIPRVTLERGSTWNALAFDPERPTLSSALVGGGDLRARRIVNLCVSGPDARAQCDDPEAAFATLAREQRWRGPIVGLMTAVSAARLGIARSGRADSADWGVMATVGLSNGHRAGASRTDLPAVEAVRAYEAGTINIVATTPLGLTAAARAEALALVVEAKVALLADLRIETADSDAIATGTGTDAVAIACGDGEDRPFTGYHTASGRALVATVQAAMRNSIAATGEDEVPR